MRVARELQPDVADISLQVGVVIDAHLPADFNVLLLTDRELLGFAEERHLLLAGDRIGRARGAKRDDRGKKEAGSFHAPGWRTPCPTKSPAVSGAPASRSTSS